VEGGAAYIGGALADDAEWMLTGLENLKELVLKGPQPEGRAPHSIPWSEEIVVRANRQKIESAPRSVELVRTLPEFDGMHRMLDLGCGAGLIGIAIVDAHPTMTGVLFDRPEVVVVAERFIREHGMEDRVTTMGGDYLTDSIDSSYDLVWASHSIRRHNLETILVKVHVALNPRGVFINISEGLTHERTCPSRMINMMLANNLYGRDSMFDQGEVAQAILDAGFRSVQTRTIEDDTHGPVTADIARK
jgi:predicted TPR repeat methyltransferase